MLELTPKLDDTSEEAVYMQLYRYIRQELIAGRIPEGAKLPSIRKLSAHLAISRMPVELAYDQLQAEGYLSSKPRSGYFASGLESSFGRPAVPLPAAGHLPSLTRAYHAAAEDRVRYDFGYGSVDLTGFPLTKWRRLMNRCLLPEHSRLLLYGDLQGEPDLRKEIAAYLHQMRGVRCSSDQIVIGAGTYHSLDLLVQLLQEETETLAVEEAVNDGVKSLFDRCQFRCVPIKLEQDGICLEDVYASGASAVYLTPSHQFPYGMTLSIRKRMQLLQWATENGAYVIENDYDGEFRYAGRPIPSLQSLDEDNRVIYLGTFSKALTPAFRISYLVLPPILLERFRQGRHSYDQLASPIFQKTLQLFLREGDFERHVRKMRSLYRKKHDTLLAAIRVLQLAGVPLDAIGTGSGLHLLVQVRNGMSETELVETAEAQGVRVYPTSRYSLEPDRASTSTVLMGFGGLSEADIRIGVHNLYKAWS